MKWSHNEEWLLTADHSGYVKYWQANMNNVEMYQAHKEPIRGVRYAFPDLESSCSVSTTLTLHNTMTFNKCLDLFSKLYCLFLSTKYTSCEIVGLIKVLYILLLAWVVPVLYYFYGDILIKLGSVTTQVG